MADLDKEMFNQDEAESPENQSIFQQIYEALDEQGRLPEDFWLSSYQSKKSGLPFAPGAEDGIIMYHVAQTGDPKLLADLQELTQKLAEGMGSDELARQLAERFAQESHDGLLGCIDGLLDWVINNSEHLPPKLIFHTAIKLLVNTRSVGVVKYALVLLELLAENDGHWREAVRVLAAYDEFTLYCAYIARHWQNANQELWQMAQNTKGWGRIHVVEMLQPKPEEQDIKAWLLAEGWQNDVLSNYSTAECAVKGDLAQVLGQPSLTAEQLAEVSGLVEALLATEPMPGIFGRGLEPETLLTDYLRHVAGQEKESEYQELIERIAQMAEEQDWSQVKAAAQSLI